MLSFEVFFAFIEKFFYGHCLLMTVQCPTTFLFHVFLNHSLSLSLSLSTSGFDVDILPSTNGAIDTLGLFRQLYQKRFMVGRYMHLVTT